jgi:UDP-glucose 4-epimerase
MDVTAEFKAFAIADPGRATNADERLMRSRTEARATSLVTGAAGFIGSHVAAELVRQGHRVVGLDDLSGGFRKNVPAGVRFIEGSTNNTALVPRLFDKYRFDYVFHLAAYAAEGLSHFIRSFNYRNNLLGSINLINASVNAGTVRCFVFTSSIAVYGKLPAPMTEALAPCPADPYGVAKYAVELDLAAAREVFGLEWIIFRPHNVYGPGQHAGDPYRNVIGIFMKQILEGRPLSIFGDGSQSRAFTHISDVAPVIAASVGRPAAYNQIFNLGSDEPTSVLALAGSVSRAMGVALRIEHLPARHEARHAYCLHDKARAYFGDLIQNVGLETGLAQMARWIKQTGLRRGEPCRTIEIEREMPACWLCAS